MIEMDKKSYSAGYTNGYVDGRNSLMELARDLLAKNTTIPPIVVRFDGTPQQLQDALSDNNKSLELTEQPVAPVSLCDQCRHPECGGRVKVSSFVKRFAVLECEEYIK